MANGQAAAEYASLSIKGALRAPRLAPGPALPLRYRRARRQPVRHGVEHSDRLPRSSSRCGLHDPRQLGRQRPLQPCDRWLQLGKGHEARLLPAADGGTTVQRKRDRLL